MGCISKTAFVFILNAITLITNKTLVYYDNL